MQTRTTGKNRARRSTPAIVLLTALGLVGPSGPATARQGQDHGPVVVRSSAEGLTLSRDVTHAGKVTISVNSLYQDTVDGDPLAGGATMFKLNPPATLATLRADFKDGVSDDNAVAARGTRGLTRHARFYGLAEITHQKTISVTQTLSAGTYYLADNLELAEGTPHLVSLKVVGTSRGHTGHEPRHLATVSMTANDRFAVAGSLPAKGSISVHNRSATPHFMQMRPVLPGTSDKAVQAWLDDGAQGDPGFFIDGPSTGLNLLSPGQNAQLTYDMPTGSYLLFCELRDARTGVPHVFMGMHKVITLK